jgi:hypothetical protein
MRVQHKRAAATSKAASPQILGATVRRTDWLPRFARSAKLTPGAAAPGQIRVPAGDAQRVLRATVRLVADLPAGSSPDVVWTQGEHELVVHTDSITLACASGLVTIGFSVDCDQLPVGKTQGSNAITVPFAVGTDKLPSGLVMSTFVRPSGPALVVDGWAEALTAFAWEALLHLAQSLCAETGRDAEGRPLVPGYVGAAANLLLIQPMARHTFSGRRL